MRGRLFHQEKQDYYRSAHPYCVFAGLVTVLFKDVSHEIHP